MCRLEAGVAAAWKAALLHHVAVLSPRGLAALAIVFWGISFVTTKAALQEIAPVTLLPRASSATSPRWSRAVCGGF